MTDRLIVVSADCHAGPHVREYRPFVEAGYHDAFDDYAAQCEAYDAGLAAKRAVGSASTDILDERNLHPALSDPDARVAMLDADGIAAEVVYPQGAIPFHQYPAISEPRGTMGYKPRDELRLPGIRAYNRWLAEFCASHPGRHLGIGVVPIRDIDAAVTEARWVKEHGLAGVSLPVLGDDMLPYNDAFYEPFWAACAELDLPLNVHGGAGRYYGTGPVAAAMIVAECDWLTRRALWMLIFSGAFERHPNLRLVFTEQRTHWVRPTLDELDSLWRSTMIEVSRVLPRSPSEYFAENVYIGGSFLSPKEAEERHAIGIDRLMWGSDFPHVEGVWPYTREHYRHTFSVMPANERNQILADNPIACYGLDRARLTAIAAKIGPTDDDFRAPTEPASAGAMRTWGFRRHGAYD